MGRRFLQQLNVILWKNYKLKTRRPILFLIELIVPLVLCIILGEVRKTKPPVVETATNSFPIGLPSAGLVPFIQSLPVIGCWDYNSEGAEYYPLPPWLEEIPNIEKAFRRIVAWPLIRKEEYKKPFASFASNDLGLTNKEAIALTVSSVDLFPVLQDTFLMTVDNRTNSSSMINPLKILPSLLSKDIDTTFDVILTEKACNGEIESIMDFPRDDPYKLSPDEIDRIGKSICSMNSAQKSTFKSYTKPDDEGIKKESQLLTSLLKDSFYPIPLGASAPVLKIYQRSLSSKFRSAQSTLALIKYYICPNFHTEMETYFVHLEQEMNNVEVSTLKGDDDNDGDNQSNDDVTQDEHSINKRSPQQNVNMMSTSKEEVTKALEQNNQDISIMQSEIWYMLTKGELFYSPKTLLVESVIKEANRSFELLDDIQTKLNNANGRVKDLMGKTEDGITGVVVSALIKTLIEYTGMEPPDNVTLFLDDVSHTLTMVSNFSSNFSLNRWTGFGTEREMELAAVDVQESEDRWLWGGITFEDVADNRTEFPSNIRYKVRMRSGFMPPLKDIRYLYWRSYPYNFLWDRQYWVYGFIYIQDMIESGITNIITNGTFDPPGFYTEMFPYPCWLNDKYLFVISRSLPFCLVVSWVYIVAMSTLRIVYEKERRLKEVMKVMGLGESVHWCGWGITLIASSSITNFFLVFILKYNGITNFTNGVVLYCLLEMFTICNIAVCFLLSVFFVQSKLAAVVSAVIFYTMYIPYTIANLQEENMDFWMKIIASLSSTTAFGFGMLQVARYEEQGVGLQWDNLYLPPDNAQIFSALHVFIMMGVDCVIYVVLTLYLQQVLPSKHGSAKKPWYFPIQPVVNAVCRKLGVDKYFTSQPLEEDTEVQEVEPVAKHLVPGVEMVSLSKHYGGKHNPYALRNLSLKLYKGQVTALLGHNGAGKTTTMSILTGMIAPSSGSFHIRSDSEEDKSKRDSIGVCPQHNILWDDLTIAEHLLFYGQLRGMKYREVNEAMKQFIREVDLPLGKRDSLVKTLSGGMKRKLSVAIAFLGNTKTLVLDEPTAGVDPKARRDIWDMLMKNKKDRTILLSTHHMEEADILGDRIAILSQGNLVCCGSSLFLKRISGGSYFLTAQINPGTPTETLTTIVGDIFQSVHVQSQTQNQIVMKLEARDMALFEKLCLCLDDMKKANEIASYGIAAPTMEDVFLKLSASAPAPEWPEQFEEREKEMGLMDHTSARNGGAMRLETIHENSSLVEFDETYAADLPASSQMISKMSTDDAPDDECDDGDAQLPYRQVPLSRTKTPKSPLVPVSGSPYNTGFRLAWQQFCALIVKRWHHAKRDKKGVFAQVVLPALFIALAMSINLAVPVQASYKPRVMSTSMFKYPNYIPFEMKIPEKNVTPIDRSVLRSEGVTYGDSFLRPIRAERDEQFESSETFSSSVIEHETNVTLIREFVQNFPACTLTCEIPKQDETAPFPMPGFQTRSGDIFTNITGANMTEYLMITQPEYKLSRYIAFTLDDHRSDINPEFVSEYTAKRHTAKSWYLNKGYHALPTGLNALRNLYLRNSGSKHHITAAAQAINETAVQTSREYILQGIPIVISIFIIVGLSFVPTSFVVYLVAERSSNAKHLQFCAGVRPVIYWLSNFVWDILNFMLPTMVATILFVGFDQQAFVREIGAVIIMIILYGCASTPMFYPASFFFKIPSAAYVTLMCFNLFVAVTTSYSVFTLERFKDDPVLMWYAHVFDKVFLIFPPYCLGKGFVDLTYKYVQDSVYKSMGIDIAGKTLDAWHWDMLGRYMLVLPVTCVFWLTFTIGLEKYTLRKREVIKTPDPEESGTNEDVDEECKRAQSSHDDILTVNGLTKQYTTYSWERLVAVLKRRPTGKFTHKAVKNITFGVKKGECFGLLGINGAGKTSTFNMLTGALSVSAGNAIVGGHCVVTDLSKVQQLLGYCPQFDAIINTLTGREMLTLFAALHGVKDPAKSANTYIRQLGIEKYSDMQCYKYSGGNKRKLSAAIALVGKPEVLLLDEPTAGMDPGARRQLWRVISDAKQSGTSVLLTSHSMGECEVLCDRIGIMCHGKLQCVGTPHFLKERYGSGYTVTIKSSHVGNVISLMEDEFVDYKLLEQHHNMLIYTIPHQSKLAPLFAFLSKLTEENAIEDYSVSQCTLEDVFINFARKSENYPPDNNTDGRTKPCIIS